MFGAVVQRQHDGTVLLLLTQPVLDGPPDVLAAILAHEAGHIAAGHLRQRALAWNRLLPLGLVAVAAIASPWLAAVAALGCVALEVHARRVSRRIEREADEEAARILGSVAPLLLLRPSPPRRVRRLWYWVMSYPESRPWLDSMAAAELLTLHEAVPAQPSM
jgi:hypothetical protein